MKTAQQVWEEAYPDRRKWEALDQDTRDEWERVVRIAQRDETRMIDTLKEILRDRCFYASPTSKTYDRSGFSLMVDEDTAILDINYRNAPLHASFDEALEAAIKLYQI